MAEAVSDLQLTLQNWRLLPPSNPLACIECGEVHKPSIPHNRDSLQYQYYFAKKFGRWPTWADAAAHCTPEAKSLLKEALAKHLIEFE